MAFLVLLLVAGLIAVLASIRSVEPGASPNAAPGKVWSEEHQHWH